MILLGSDLGMRIFSLEIVLGWNKRSQYLSSVFGISKFMIKLNKSIVVVPTM